MRRRLRLLVLPAVLLLGGCFQVHSTLNISADGRAQLVERITMEGTMAMMMMAGGDLMAAFEVDGDSTAVEEEISPEEALRLRFADRAATLGAGVTVASVVEELAPGQLTYVVTYDIPDVNTFAYDFSNAVDPDAMFGTGASDDDWEAEEWEGDDWEIEEVPAGDMEDVIGDGEIIDEPGDEIEADATGNASDGSFRFAFTPATGGEPATLRVIVPAQPVDQMGDLDFNDLTSSDDPDQEIKMAYVMVGRMGMAFDVVVDGELVSADRGWADGNRVTLTSLQMGEVLDFMRGMDDVAGIESLVANRDPASDIDLPGIRFVGSGDVEIRFQ